MTDCFFGVVVYRYSLIFCGVTSIYGVSVYAISLNILPEKYRPIAKFETNIWEIKLIYKLGSWNIICLKK